MLIRKKKKKNNGAVFCGCGFLCVVDIISLLQLPRKKSKLFCLVCVCVSSVSQGGGASLNELMSSKVNIFSANKKERFLFFLVHACVGGWVH